MSGPSAIRSAIRTACPYCGVGCGVLASPDGKGGAAIAGDPEHPANFGRLCSKGAALGETLSLEGRLLTPRIAGRAAGWDEASALVARRFSEAIAEHGPDSVAFYVSGQLLTEDYYVFNKLMKGFIGSANIDTNSRLCMASAVAAHRRAFGADTVPCTYEDLEEADLVVVTGSNLAWCHPVLHQRLLAARDRRPEMRIVVLDPRRTATAAGADRVLHLRADSDAALFGGLLNQIEAEGAIDAGFVGDHVGGLPEALAAARALPLDAVAAATGLEASEIRAFYADWIRAEKVVTLFSQGINQSAHGTDKANAILNAHLATGRIGRPGMGPFSITGQPNAMGGREVGGLANMLAAHLELENAGHRAAVQAFWDAPAIAARPGLKAVELFHAVGEGRIKALWIAGTNPAVSMPAADRVAAAIRACPFVVVSDVMAETDTVRLADVALPAAAWGEKSGTVTNSERRVTRQRAFLPVPGQARPDWRIVCDVAGAMGWARAFDYRSASEIFREHAALSGIAAGLGRDFDIGALAGLSGEEYEALSPVQWPLGSGASHADARPFADGRFYTRDGRARMVPVTRPAATARTRASPRFRLNSGRIRDHWHTMTRTAKSPRLSRHIAEPYVEIHPADAAACGIAPAELAELSNAAGRVVLRALVTDRVARGTLFAPMHWNGDWSSAGRVNILAPDVADPVSGQPALKAASVRLARYDAAWHGYAIGRRAVRGASDYWATARIEGGWQVEMAGLAWPQDPARLLAQLFGLPGGDVVGASDAGAGNVRLALLAAGRVEAMLFIARGPVAVARAHLAQRLADGDFGLGLLAGRPGGATPDPGSIVCSCFGVGATSILRAAAERRLVSAEEVGEVLSAGTGCGSCRPEIAALLAANMRKIAAE